MAQAEPLESSPPGEAADIDAVVGRALQEIRSRYPAGSALVRRDAHAKAHGCAKATFRVNDDIPDDLRVGLFAKPGVVRKAWVRFSNGAFEPGPDTGRDGRGMALKILAEPPGAATGAAPAHDILMINHPRFFSGDARDYRDFAEAGALTGDGAGLRRYFAPSFNPLGWRLRQGTIAYSIATEPIESPLSSSYFSMAPFAFGDGRAVKYAARPCGGGASPATPSGERGADYLRAALVEGLNRTSACFDLLVQERKHGMSIEDATAEWSESASPYRPVGVVNLLRQPVADPGKDALCETLSFSPWNASFEQRPLGGINRLRKAVYEAISTHRRDANQAVVPDASAEWDRF